MNFTRLYLTMDTRMKGERAAMYHLMSNKLYVVSYNLIGEQNWIFDVEYDKLEDLKRTLGDHKIRGTNISVRRIFKSINFKRCFEDKPCYSFLDNIICLISASVKEKVNIRVVNNNANDWQGELLRRWQKEIENPNKFKQLKINNKVDIRPDGDLVFHINRVKDHIVTYFDSDISEFYQSKRRT